MALFIMVIARVASIPLWMRSKPWQASLLIPLFAFVDCDPVSALYWTMLETLLSNLICFRFYLSNSVCNNLVSYSDDENVSMNFI